MSKLWPHSHSTTTWYDFCKLISVCIVQWLDKYVVPTLLLLTLAVLLIAHGVIPEDKRNRGRLRISWRDIELMDMACKDDCLKALDRWKERTVWCGRHWTDYQGLRSISHSGNDRIDNGKTLCRRVSPVRQWWQCTLFRFELCKYWLIDFICQAQTQCKDNTGSNEKSYDVCIYHVSHKNCTILFLQ